MAESNKKISSDLCFLKNPNVDYIPFQRRICAREKCTEWVSLPDTTGYCKLGYVSNNPTKPREKQ